MEACCLWGWRRWLVCRSGRNSAGYEQQRFCGGHALVTANSAPVTLVGPVQVGLWGCWGTNAPLASRLPLHNCRRPLRTVQTRQYASTRLHTPPCAVCLPNTSIRPEPRVHSLCAAPTVLNNLHHVGPQFPDSAPFSLVCTLLFPVSCAQFDGKPLQLTLLSPINETVEAADNNMILMLSHSAGCVLFGALCVVLGVFPQILSVLRCGGFDLCRAGFERSCSSQVVQWHLKTFESVTFFENLPTVWGLVCVIIWCQCSTVALMGTHWQPPLGVPWVRGYRYGHQTMT